MPLFRSKTEDKFRIEIWKMEEEVDELISRSALSREDLKKIESFQSIHRKKEWLCVRLMLQQINENPSASVIVYDEHGKPHLENSQTKISISHTKDYVGIIISENYHVGIDLERIHPRIEKITYKFLSKDEKIRIPSTNKLHYYYLMWGTKEVIYKIHGKGGLLFSKNILTEPFEMNDKGMLNASINAPGIAEQRFQVNYEFINDLLLTYAVVH